MTGWSPKPVAQRSSAALARAIGLVAACGAAILTLGITLMALVTFVPGLDRPGVPLRGVANFLYADHEANAWAWYSTLLLAAIAAGLGLLAYLWRCAGRRVAPLLVLAGLAVYMSADEAAAMHERFSNLVPSVWTWGWLAIGVPLAVLAGLVSLRLARALSPRLKRRLVLGGALFLLGAVVTEMIAGMLVVAAGSYDEGTTTAPYMLALFLEEALELSGVLVALWAILSEVRVHPGSDGARLALAELPACTAAAADVS